MVRPVARFDNSVASFTRCASPPESVVEDCPSLIYPSPTSRSVSSLFASFGRSRKNSSASSTVISSTSAMLLPL